MRSILLSTLPRAALALVTVLALAGCYFLDSELVPSLTGEDPAGRAQQPPRTVSAQPVQLGQTNFVPPGVTDAQRTGTQVGERVEQMRGDLRRLQTDISAQNQTLQGLRTRVVGNAQKYQGLIGTIQSRLQVGTTPGNPVLLTHWNDAQSTLNALEGDIAGMNNLANRVVESNSLAAFVLESTRATYGLSGAVDEDHRQLAILEDEVNRTVVLIDRLLNELNQYVARQTNYVGGERRNLSALSTAVANGELYGSSLANRAWLTSAPAASQPLAGPGNFASRRPLVVIRFDRPEVPYANPLYTAANEALSRLPEAVFDIVAVTPQAGTPAQVAMQSSTARRNAEDVAQTLERMGMPRGRISLNAMTSPQAQVPEVHVFVR
ncbi:MAG: hypothetical protein FJX53_13035 [Alphaproteobacteria bacterium]|nr:hypothetical protein [Alphaproteobacteria bacterium]